MSSNADIIDQISPEAYARLGMEARSISKSIQTEETKLIQSKQFTRSDRHYFRARYNYYRLSLMRLPNEEREMLEPALARFQTRINSLEVQQDEGPPFLTPVENLEITRTLPEAPVVVAPAPATPEKMADAEPPSFKTIVQPEISQSLIAEWTTKESLKDTIGELQVLKVALMADLNPEARKILTESVDRIIKRIRLASSSQD